MIASLFVFGFLAIVLTALAVSGGGRVSLKPVLAMAVVAAICLGAAVYFTFT